MDSRDDLIDGIKVIVGDQPGNPLAPVWRNPTETELIAVVRRGVESGTIKGEVKGWCSVHDAQSWDGRDLFCLLHPGDPEERSCEMERRLVLPFDLASIATDGQGLVSDGGSET